MIKYVYVAGPITKGDTLMNIRRGIDTGADLKKLGFAPFIPHYDYPAYMWRPDAWDYESCLDYDFDWLLRCDAMLRLPGESAGADREEAFCNDNNIPVFYTIDALVEAANGRTTH